MAEASSGECATSDSISQCARTDFPYYRSQWPRGLKREMSSPSRALGSGVRILLKA
jgi:hypothetical protein